jgi:hypothetical protein
MIDPREMWVSADQIRATEAARIAKDDKEKPRSPKKVPKVDFLQHSIPLLLKLRNENASCIIWAMVCALSEAWFTRGRHGHHPNPFPLAAMDSTKWKLTRGQKSRALQFLARIGLIKVDRSDSKRPLVTIAWESPYEP